ncbi:MAG: hypothetical protein KKA81_02375 [Bacteroidetes bacterium]|nr:hypothetical protein [Bacteroidota bacterium]
MTLITGKNVHRAVKFMNSKNGGRLVPYKTGCRWIHKFCSSEFALEHHFRNRIQLLKEFVANMPGSPSMDKIFPDVLITNFLRPWKSMALARMSVSSLKKVLHTEGLEIFEQAVQKGKGVILVNSHYGFVESALSVFPNLGYKNFYTIIRGKGSTSMKISGLGRKRQPNIIVFKDHSNAELFRIMFKAREVLNQGGIFHILGDGYHGKSSITVNFLGRVRGFRGSFAELGLSTEASILPIFITTDNQGNLFYHIENELDKGDDSLPHPERVEYIVKQYTSRLEHWWKKEPQHIHWGFMEKYLRSVREEG